ncbi:CC0125/CC1285 family lipoprotein [Parvularcula maris]|uniref:DUF4136 domain-containing protein n=1 Tax=Parvularcula maris TaxID=2965077 RepID=A0A9X2L6L5_9PROT|nr:hypothetical protein [Parvularcula maris]MCQ8183943.1 hypothetical protein [Parvularcula maris]
MKHHQMAAAALVFLAAGCAGTPAYGPAEGSGFGYREQAIETTRYRVSYKAKSPIEAEDGALRRAAELTRQKGFDHFTVTARNVDRERSASPRSSVGIGGSTGGRRSGVGLGVSVPLGGSGSESATARLEIVMGNGAKPDDPRSYDAAAVLSNLGS